MRTDHFCVGATVYAKACVSGGDVWCRGHLVELDEVAKSCVALLEVPEGKEFAESFEIAAKKKKVACLLVRGPLTGVHLEKPATCGEMRVTLTGGDALLGYTGLEPETFLSLSEEDSETAQLRAQVSLLQAELAKLSRKPPARTSRSSSIKSVSFGEDLADSDVEDEEEEGAEDDAVLRLAQAMQGSWNTVGARSSAQGTTVGKNNVSKSGSASRTEQSTGNVSQENLNMMVMTEMLRALKDLRRRKKDDSDGDDDEDTSKSSKVGRTVRAYNDLKSQVQRQPKKIIKEFLETVTTELGVTPGMAYTVRDYAKKIPWTKHRTLQKCYEMHVAIWEHLEAQQPLQAQAQVVQNLRHSWLMTGLVDPGRARLFAGSERELEIVSQYAKELDELAKKTKENRKVDEA